MEILSLKKHNWVCKPRISKWLSVSSEIYKNVKDATHLLENNIQTALEIFQFLR